MLRAAAAPHPDSARLSAADRRAATPHNPSSTGSSSSGSSSSGSSSSNNGTHTRCCARARVAQSLPAPAACAAPARRTPVPRTWAPPLLFRPLLLLLLLLGAGAPGAHARPKLVGEDWPDLKLDTRPELSFLEVASKYQNEKVVYHSYHHAYQKYLSPLRNKEVRLLEIGLGCVPARYAAHYSPGRSFGLWREFVPRAIVSMLELNERCARDWAERVYGLDRLYVGSQDDPALLARVVKDARSRGLYDVIVDDGSHQPAHVMASLRALWPAVKRGGHYIVEDLEVAYMAGAPFGGGPPGTRGTVIQYFKDTIDRLNCRSMARYGLKDEPVCREQLPGLLSVECYAELCVLTKSPDPPQRRRGGRLARGARRQQHKQRRRKRLQPQEQQQQQLPEQQQPQEQEKQQRQQQQPLPA